MFTEKLAVASDHALMLEGLAGPIEAVLTVPEDPLSNYFALLGHPHSLQGGTMNNKVVTTLARAFKALGIPSLRMNFRGVGQSGGVFDGGIGESEDMLVLKDAIQSENKAMRVLFAGFSFGSYVAYRAAGKTKSDLLITIAPPVHHFDYQVFSPHPWFIIQGEEDEVVPPNLVFDFAKSKQPPLTVLPFAKTGHFFHGKLLELKDAILTITRQALHL